MLNKLIIVFFILTCISSAIAKSKMVFDPKKGITDTVSFGDTFNISKMKENFGEINDTTDYGINGDGVNIKTYSFKSGFGCTTANDKIIQMWISSKDFELNSGLKPGCSGDDIINQYGRMFITEGNPILYGEGILTYNLYPNHLMSVSINKENTCKSIMSADCNLIYKISPTYPLLLKWDAPFNLQKPPDTVQKMNITKDSSSLDGTHLIIKGEIINNTQKTIHYVKVTAVIYDGNGQIIDTQSVYIDNMHLSAESCGQFTVISNTGKDGTRYELKISSDD